MHRANFWLWTAGLLWSCSLIAWSAAACIATIVYFLPPSVSGAEASFVQRVHDQHVNDRYALGFGLLLVAWVGVQIIARRPIHPRWAAKPLMSPLFLGILAAPLIGVAFYALNSTIFSLRINTIINPVLTDNLAFASLGSNFGVMSVMLSTLAYTTYGNWCRATTTTKNPGLAPGARSNT